VMKDQGGFLLNFLRGLRHDLTSPITQLKDIIEYYKKTVDPHKKERSAMLIDDCLLKLTNTAKGFSNFVDIHLLANNEIEEINMMEIFEETKQVLASEISDAVVQINCDFGQANMVYFNKKLISSILYNLLSNALKFRKQSNQLVISITSYIEAGYFQLKIVDNGIGIDLDKHRDHLFVPFKRFTMDRPGAGIALSMIKNILNRYEGDIIIESEANVGTTVFVKIPINNKTLFKRQ